MAAPFDRRDSASFTGFICFLAFALTLAEAGQWLGWGREALGLAAAAAVLTAAVLAILLRRLPPDRPLRRLSAAAAQLARSKPPPGMARLRVALRPEPLGWYRLDIRLDGVRIGQLRPGTALVLAMTPGEHTLTASVWLRTLRARELINALPGTDTDIVVQGSGSRVRDYGIERHGMAAALAGDRIVLVEPFAADAASTGGV